MNFKLYYSNGETDNRELSARTFLKYATAGIKMRLNDTYSYEQVLQFWREVQSELELLEYDDDYYDYLDFFMLNENEEPNEEIIQNLERFRKGEPFVYSRSVFYFCADLIQSYKRRIELLEKFLANIE